MPEIVLCLGQALDSNSGYHVAGLGRRLHDRGASVTVLSGSGHRDSWATSTWQDGRLTSEELSWSGLCRALARKPAADVVHCWTTRPMPSKLSQLVSMSQATTPLRVLHLEDSEGDVLAEMAQETPARLADLSIGDFVAAYGTVWSPPRWHDRMVALADAFTVLAPSLRPTTDKPVLEFAPGVDRAFFAPVSPEQRRGLRRSAGITDRDIVIVYAGNIQPAVERDFRSLVDAVRLLRRDGLPVRLITCGGSYSATLQPDLAAAQDGWQHLGWLERGQVRDLMLCGDLAVQPGHDTAYNRGRYPSKLPEFLASGLPVVVGAAFSVTDDMAAKEAVVPVRDASALGLAEVLRPLCLDADRRAALGRAARAYAEVSFDWDVVAEQCLRLYRAAQGAEGSHV